MPGAGREHAEVDSGQRRRLRHGLGKFADCHLLDRETATSTAPALSGCSEKRTREGGSGSNRTVGASGEMNVPISKEEVVPPTEFESVPPA
jgi:hypothetical protein